MKKKRENRQKSEFWSSTKKIHNSFVHIFWSIVAFFSTSRKKIKTRLVFGISILLRTICEFLTSIFAKKSNFSNLLKSLASELLGRSENLRIESCREFTCLQFECSFRQISQLKLEIYSKTSEQLLKFEKKCKHWYIENASIEKFLSAIFVFSGSKYIGKS